MTTPRTLIAIVGVLAASLTLSACSPAEGDSDAGTSSSSTEAFNDQDVMFARMMVPHHEQAVEMSDMILAKDGVDPDVTEIAQQIRDAQQPEIEQMEGWLDDWDSSMDMGDMDHGMDGMMSDDDMGELDAAPADTASALFLEQMIEHHEGAIDMAQDELDDGEYPDALQLAETITETQQSEIERMQELLAQR
ncbi:DUF305 domain-containing protein [Marisediminicola senii]|uniref:DUF305 domain-containing protein n=1 Tax=Marisediminicola senii TaxID=2711233 RepID=UPI0013EAA9F2|nr:DUF305 domain-containing protein [Marisediminicola senii]